MPKAQKDSSFQVQKSRNWLLTIPNPVCDDVKDHPDIVFVAYQIERGKPSEIDALGHRHMHVFVVFECQRHRQAVAKFFSYLGIAHLDPCDLNAYFYVIKKPGDEGSWEEKDFSIDQPAKQFGNIPAGLSRICKSKGSPSNSIKSNTGKLDKIASDILLAQRPLQDIILENPGLSLIHKNKITEFQLFSRHLSCRDRVWKPLVIWLYGLTGTGKTRSVYDIERLFFKNNPDDVNISGRDQCFVNGYFGNDAVLIDETRGEIPYKELLKLLDWNRGGKNINAKGIRDAMWFPKRIYLTSCYHPEDIYKGQMTKSDRIDQLLRRIDHVLRVETDCKVGDSYLLPILQDIMNEYNEKDMYFNVSNISDDSKMLDFGSGSSGGIKNPTPLEPKKVRLSNTEYDTSVSSLLGNLGDDLVKSSSGMCTAATSRTTTSTEPRETFECEAGFV